jgi:hypothetical protein
LAKETEERMTNGFFLIALINGDFGKRKENPTKLLSKLFQYTQMKKEVIWDMHFINGKRSRLKESSF